jgi:regulator of protease activity HflC (stomatin/prohibitin superfamily)
MTSGDTTQARVLTADEAMNRVLAAERDARLAVAECQAEAARLIAAAESRARALASLSEAHIRTAHQRADAAIAHALAELAQTPLPDQAAGKEAGHETGAAGGAPLAEILDVLVAEILGAGT